ncbi:MAG TPA: cytochrome c, partial [Anaerolineales bacterium]|nr:cytochrome c [Anaerolineales bacterium]
MFRKVLRFLGILLAILVGLVGILAVFIYFRSEAILNQTFTTPSISLKEIPLGDSEAIERGRYLANVVSACVDCHGKDFGGGVVVDDPALGRVVAPNLTTGQNGLGSARTDEDLIRVLRYGVKHDQTSVKVMPADDYSHFDDTDLGAVIAYLRSLPPVNSNLPNTEFRPVGRALLAFGQLDIMIAPRINFAEAGSSTQTASVNLEYGSYLANIS